MEGRVGSFRTKMKDDVLRMNESLITPSAGPLLLKTIGKIIKSKNCISEGKTISHKSICLKRLVKGIEKNWQKNCYFVKIHAK